jgi:superfamily I DNA/RNA helicase/RecB family exonuclease
MAADVATATGRALSSPMVRTAASVAVAILRARAVVLGEPAPTLITGPEQDRDLAEILAGHVDGEGVPLTLPDSLPPEVLGLRGFRHELRDLLMRAAEQGVSPEYLAELGQRFKRDEWILGAQLYREYLGVQSLRTSVADQGDRLDPAVVVSEAAECIATWDAECQPAPCPSWDLVIVDDYQDVTVATVRLLGELFRRGSRLVLLGDPDVAVQAFRGGSPAFMGRAASTGAEVGAFGASVMPLGTSWRQGSGLRQVTERVIARVPAVGTVRHRRMEVMAPEGMVGSVAPPEGMDVVASEGAVNAEPAGRVAIVGNSGQESAWIARELRKAHLVDGIEWRDMAVITRSTSHLTAIRRDLIAASVPVGLLGSDVPLREEPAVIPLLRALEWSLTTDPEEDHNVESAVSLLCSPVGGLNAVGMRRLRRALRALELAHGGGRNSDALVVEILTEPEGPRSVPRHLRQAPTAVSRVLEAGGEAAKAPGATVQTILWAIWAATGLADVWRAQALAGGSAGSRADRDLDAVMALFRAAETYVDRTPGAAPSAFVEYLRSQDLPADSLASSSSGISEVAALTPAGAAGREWELVVVAGVQEGVWPDLRLRDSLLGSEALVELLSGRSDSAQTPGRQAREAVLADEIRAFALAVSRARSTLLVTAVDSEDDSPSVLCDLVEEPHFSESGLDSRRVTVGTPFDLRGVVTEARGLLAQDSGVAHQGGPGDGLAGDALGGDGTPLDGTPFDTVPWAARFLADLAREGVVEADPSTWYGVRAQSSEEPLWEPGETVPVSPSKVEAVHTCPLRWALESAGGVRADASAQTLGSLIHSIAEEHPQGTLGELQASLDQRFAELGLKPGWETIALRKRADLLITRLAQYLATARPPAVVPEGSDRPDSLGLEAGFSVDVGRARLRGKIDRIEDCGDGSVRVVDLKTGKQAVSVAEAGVHPQLGAYQVAIESGGFGLPPGTRCAGGSLVYVGTTAAKVSERFQKSLQDSDDPTWARTLVTEAADTMACAEFEARDNQYCSMCSVRNSCPLQDQGIQVTS